MNGSGNLVWLFGAFAFAWAIVFGYLFRLSRKEAKLRSRVAVLESMLNERP